MKKTFLKTGLIICSAALLPLLASAQEKATIAISSIKPTASLAAAVNGKVAVTSASDTKQQALVFDTKQELNRVIESLDGQLIDRVNATRKFDVLSRSDLADVLKEQDLGASGNVDAKTAAKARKLSGAKYLLVATVDDFQDYIEKAVFEGTGQTATKRVFRFSVVGKLYDSTTGKLLESANFQTGNDEFKQIQQERSYSVKSGELSDEMMVAIARSMAEKIATHIADVIFPPKILVKRDTVVTINRGEGGGVAEGDVFNVFAQGEELKDPDTGEVLGREEVKVGKIKITQVNAKTSQGEILEDTGVDKGAVLHKAK
ncbi:MAG TPA: CsgG/HfaB family protein [Verrucomicrobiae bacterium]|jgi:curli biogenesis system outer membrane secretion channel CsgG